MVRTSTGVIPSQGIREMIRKGHIRGGPVDSDIETYIQPTALDLTIAPEAGNFEIARGSTAGPVPLNERLALPEHFHARSDARSRYAKAGVSVDVVTEDGQPIPPGYRGRLYANISTRSFSVRAVPNVSVAHTRFYSGDPRESLLKAGTVLNGMSEYVLDRSGAVIMHLLLSVPESGGSTIYASRETEEVLDLARGDNPIGTFFDKVNGANRCCVSPPGHYIMCTREELRTGTDGAVPLAYEMPRMNPAGNLQVNAASLIEHGSWGRQALEIMPSGEYVLTDGEPVCRIVFYRVMEKPDKEYGARNNNHNLFTPAGALFRE